MTEEEPGVRAGVRDWLHAVCRYGNFENCPGHLSGIRREICVREGAVPQLAGVAQSVEHLICNQRVRGSNPFASSKNEFPAGRRKQFSGATGFPNALHLGIFPTCSGFRARVCSRHSCFSVLLRSLQDYSASVRKPSKRAVGNKRFRGEATTW